MKIKPLKYKEISELRKRLLKEQNGICPICKRTIISPVLDHHHVKRIKGSGLIRGVLCSLCNVLLGKIENNCNRYKVKQEELSTILRNISAYLEQKHLPYLHPSEVPKEPKLKKSSYNALKKKASKYQKWNTPYPQSGKLTKKLAILFTKYHIEPEFYKD